MNSINETCPTCGREVSKTNLQRNMFHQFCRQIGNELGLEPGLVKDAIKLDFFGVDEYKIGDKLYHRVKSSEDAGKFEYSELIDYAYRWAADKGIYV